MQVTQTPLAGLLVLQPQAFKDERGWFMESFNEKRFHAAVGEPVHFVQDNHSFSTAGVLRGLHYQIAPHPQAKLVRVVEGAVWDVAVDLRAHSATRGQWFGVDLSAENQKQLWIPAGFAHGFLTLSATSQFLYKTTHFYDQASERAILWNDPTLAIAWPLQGTPLVNAKDLQAQLFADTPPV
jgi:dTDP-4-dehydrorhamnose 3,5-epimerase